MKENSDSSGYVGIIVRRRRTIAVITISAVAVALLLSLLFPKYYVSTITFYIPTYQAQQISLAGAANELVKAKFPIPVSGDAAVGGVMQILKSITVAERVAEVVPGRDAVSVKNNASFEVSNEGIFTIKVQDSDPEIAARIANEFPPSAGQFLETTTAAGAGAQRIKEILTDEIEHVRARADSVEGELRAFLDQNEVISVDKEIGKLIDLDANLRTQKLTTQVTLLENNVKMEALTEQMNLAGNDAIENLLGTNEVVLKLRARAADLEIRIAELKQTYTEEHPEIISLRAALAETQATLKNEIEKIFDSYTEPVNPIVSGLKEEYIDLQIQRSVLQSKNDILDSALEKMELEFQNLSQIQYDFAKLKKEALMLNRMHNSLSIKLEEIKFQEQQKGPRFIILDPAEVQPDPSYPNMPINLLVSLTFSMLAGILMCLIWETRESRQRESIMEVMSEEDLKGIFAGEE